ncbi:hypothetical protein COLO4_07133 [Corchorus olitorius]|uniref:1-phosphatidylinositol 4-kinase n=1 Tax=Corchorus olitorius TaxID=93759 RepID=A0A1R3KKT4_9ROSI|nr:hypothetical protein COLO4_07133 [Corchorus olitorius]
MAVAIDQNHGFKPCTLQSLSIVDVRHTNLAQSLKQVFEVATNLHRSFSTPCLSFATNNLDTHPRIEIIGGPCAPRVRALVVEVAIAIASGVVPRPVSSGLGGAYLLNDQSGETIAVAKPIDEEPFALNNPKGFGGLMLGQAGIKRSIRVGETGIRELAAYLLDNAYGGFAGVPVTALVKISHVAFHHVNEFTSVPNYKIASLQNFVSHDFDAGEVGSSGFSVASVHRIGIFDIRILNLDRHSGNILVRKNDNATHELVPIDHGLCLPEWLDDPYFEWLHWPQASVPFSDFEMDYISNLDPFKDAQLLRAELPSLKDSSLRILILCTIFLKQAADFGLCLADIGAMMTREFRSNEENSSILEIICAKAKETTSFEAQGDDHDINYTSNFEPQGDEDYEIFQFDAEVEDMNYDVEDLPWAKPPKPKPRPRRVSSARSMPAGLHGALLEENKENENENENENEQKISGTTSSFDESKAAGAVGLVKSMSFSVQNYNYEGGGICFGEMSEDEWEMFLKSFDKLLPQVFEDTKCMHAKQRLGTSCKF